VARGKAERWMRGQSLGAMKIALQEGGITNKRLDRDVKRLHSRCAEGLTGQRCAVEMGDGERKGRVRSCRAAPGDPVKRPRRLEHGAPAHGKWRRVRLVTSRGRLSQQATHFRHRETRQHHETSSRRLYRSSFAPQHCRQRQPP
jgi:hypothetical protein